MQQSSAAPSVARGVGRILVAGADAESFLQGQLTQDVRKAGDPPVIGGYCSAKGRLLAVMELQRVADGIVLAIHRSVLDATLKRLRLFVLRSKVTFAEIDPLVAPEQDENWRRERIARGVPTIFPATSDHFVPQMCNLDALGGVSFDKGCYTGQEVVARLHYLGQPKRRMFRAAISEPATAGEPVYDVATPAQAAGEVVDAVEGRALIVLQLGHAQGNLRLGSAAGAAITSLERLVAETA
jgi:folate-binding protein YgfZ